MEIQKINSTINNQEKNNYKPSFSSKISAPNDFWRNLMEKEGSAALLKKIRDNGSSDIIELNRGFIDEEGTLLYTAFNKTKNEEIIRQKNGNWFNFLKTVVETAVDKSSKHKDTTENLIQDLKI